MKIVAPKIMNSRQLLPLGRISSQANATALLRGYLGITPSVEAKTTMIHEVVVQGRFLADGDSEAVLISGRLASKLGVEVGDRVHFFDGDFRVVGIFDDTKLYATEDLDGWSIVPKKIVIPPPAPADCRPDEIVIVVYQTAESFPLARLAKVDVLLDDPASIPFLARLAAFDRGLRAWWNLDGRIQLTYPTFLVALVGGGVGYVAGLSTYRFMSILHLSIPAEGKFAVHWALGAFGIALFASLLGAAWPALKATQKATPSEHVKWKLSWTPYGESGAWAIDLPFQLKVSEADSFIKYFETLPTQAWMLESVEHVEPEGTSDGWRLRFDYRNSLGMELVRMSLLRRLLSRHRRLTVAYLTSQRVTSRYTRPCQLATSFSKGEAAF